MEWTGKQMVLRDREGSVHEPSIPPRPDVTPGPVAVQSITPSRLWYRRIRGLGQVIAILLGVQIALLVAQALAYYLPRISLLHRASRGELVTPAQVQSLDSRLDTLLELWLLVFIATAVLWFVWQHQAHANAQHLTTKKLKFSPGSAVAWWFIPFANFVQPFRAVRELWQASGGTDSQEEGTWPVLWLWWAGCLGSFAFSEIADSSRPNATTLSDFIRVDELELIFVTLAVASAMLAIAIVRSVERRQQFGIQAWAETLPTQIPPPPAPSTEPASRKFS